MLNDETHDVRNTQIYRVVYHKSAVATIGGTEHHLVKKHEDNKDGYAAWNALCEWYYGDAAKNET